MKIKFSLKTGFIKIYIEYCGKLLKFCGRLHFPKPPPPFCRRPLWPVVVQFGRHLHIT